jgi:hypothetical protein
MSGPPVAVGGMPALPSARQPAAAAIAGLAVHRHPSAGSAEADWAPGS